MPDDLFFNLRTRRKWHKKSHVFGADYEAICGVWINGDDQIKTTSDRPPEAEYCGNCRSVEKARGR